MTTEEKVYIPTKAILEVALRKASESALALSTNKDDGLPRLTMTEVEEGYVTLKVAKGALKLAHLMYVRRLVKEGKLEGIKVAVPGGSRWLVTKESIALYSKTRVRRGAKRNYTLRIKPEEEAKVRALLKKNEVEYTLEMAYVKKEKKTVSGESAWAKVIAKLEE